MFSYLRCHTKINFMNWNSLTDIAQLESIDKESQNGPVLILKHSTRCSISSAALSRLERKWQDADNEKIKPYYLDLLNHRDISNAIADRYQIMHQSPQALIIKDGKCVFTETHMSISYDDIIANVA